jgi:hypothetical protein
MTAPFGIALGSTPNNTDGIYTVVFTKVPKSHPKFPVIIGYWTPEKGLSEINGYSKWFDSGWCSLALNSEYENIKDQLARRYGAYTDVHDCAFAASQLSRFELACLPASVEVITGVIWRSDAGADLPSDLDHIMLIVQAMIDGEARICLSYASYREDISLGDVL